MAEGEGTRLHFGGREHSQHLSGSSLFSLPLCCKGEKALFPLLTDGITEAGDTSQTVQLRSGGAELISADAGSQPLQLHNLRCTSDPEKANSRELVGARSAEARVPRRGSELFHPPGGSEALLEGLQG